MEVCGVTWEMLAEYQEGRTDGPTRAGLDKHLAAGCSECQVRLEWIRRVAPAFAAPVLGPAPIALQRRARAVFRDRLRRPAARPWPLIARLLTRGGAAPAFARGEAGRSPSEHRVYAVSDREIDLWEETQSGGVSYIIGQLLSAKLPVPALASASLTTSNQEAIPITAILEDDEFHLAGVPAGIYTLTLVLAEETILVPNIAVGGGADAGQSTVIGRRE